MITTRATLDRALDAFAFGRGTRADMETIAREAKLERVWIECKLSRPPKSLDRIRLPIKGASRWGPWSAEGSAVQHVTPGRRYKGVWGAWWLVADLRKAVGMEYS